MTYSAEQLELRAFIQAENSKFTTEAKASGAVMIMTAMDDLDAWAAMGVYNIEQYQKASLIGEIRDVEKDTYGFRLHTDYSNSTVEQLQQELDDLYGYARAEKELQAQEEQERQEKIRMKNFEFRQASNIMMQAFLK